MTSAILDRYNGVVADQAIKIPVIAASTGVLTLSGQQTVDGISLIENDRVLYTHGTTDNGIYVVTTGVWSRSTDFDGTFDIVKGTLIYITSGIVNGGNLYVVTSADPITIGTTILTFSSSLFNPLPPAATESTAGIAELATQAETNAGTDDARIVTPLKLDAKIAIAVPAATEATAGRAELATQAETNAGTDDARIVTPLKLVTYTATILPTASETVAGKAELATQAETNAGTDDLRIVTPLKLTTFINATVPAATETVAGKAEIATQAEVTTGTDDTRIVTPLKLGQRLATDTLAGIAEIATQAEVDTGTDDARIVTPLKLAVAVPAASATTAGKAELATQAETTTGTDDTRIVTPFKLAGNVLLDAYGMSNGILVWSQAGNALTVTLKTQDGGTPTASDPVKVRFRNATLNNGDYVIRSITAALSLTVTSGSTLGLTSGQASRVRAVLIDNAGAVKIGVYLASSGTQIIRLDESALYTTVAEGGAGGADLPFVLYSDAVYSSRAILEVGYVESNQAIAGTWASTLDRAVSIGHGRYHKAGDMVQRTVLLTGVVTTGITTTPADDTIPQITEGDEYMSRTIVPLSAANLIDIVARVHITHSAPTAFTVALHVAGNSNALAATNERDMHHNVVAGTTVSRTYTIRCGNSGAGTMTFNGNAGARLYGGVMNSSLVVSEFFA